MGSRVAKFRLVRCPKCFKLLSEFTDIPVYQCDACSTFLRVANSISKDRLNIFNLETSRRSSNAYDARISSNENDSTDHPHNKYRLLSRRTFRLQKVSESASNISKEEEVTKSSRGCNEIASKSGAGQAYGSLLMEPSFILNALASDKRDRIELLRKVDYVRNQRRGVNDQIVERRFYHQSTSKMAQIGHHHCSMCSTCPYNNHCTSSNQEAEKFSMREKTRQARRHCMPMFNGAPFVICNECFGVLLLPLDFLVSKKSNKLQCGACLKVLALPFPAKEGRTIGCNVSYDKNCTKNCAVDDKSVLLLKSSGSSFQVRNCEQELGLPLHQLMGYFSATELLYQVSDVDEGYESSEPAMPDSYRCYEERRKNFLLQHSEDEAHFDPVGFNEEEEGTSPNKLNRRDLKPPHSLAKRI